MRAILVSGQGRDATLVMGEAPDPEPRSGEVRIAVAATAVNRADLLQKRGLYPPPPGASDILGLECAGAVDRIGEGVSAFAAGDRVMALLPGGGYAEKVTVHAGSVMRVPAAMGFEEAAALPEGALTAYLNLFELGRAAEGEWALVHGGSGGVGTAATALLKSEGVRTIVTAGSEERRRRCLEAGADAALNYREGPFAPQVLTLTGGLGVDVILDAVGAPYLEANLACLRTGGRLVLIGLMGGRKAEIDLATVLMKRLSIVGSTLRGRAPEEKERIIRRFVKRFGGRIESGAIAPVVGRMLPLEEAEEAHALMERGDVFGKIVLRVRGAA